MFVHVPPEGFPVSLPAPCVGQDSAAFKRGEEGRDVQCLNLLSLTLLNSESASACKFRAKRFFREPRSFDGREVFFETKTEKCVQKDFKMHYIVIENFMVK